MKRLALGSTISLLMLFGLSPASRADLVPSPPPTNIDFHSVPIGAPWLTGPVAPPGAGAGWPGPSTSKNTGILNEYQVGGTDLGIPWNDGAGHILIAFGDSFGGGSTSSGNWRRGTLAWTPDGSTISGMLVAHDTLSGWEAGTAIAPDPTGSPDDGALPTAGFSVGGTDFMHFMAMNKFCPVGGNWTTYYSGIALRGSTIDGTLPSQEQQFARMDTDHSTTSWIGLPGYTWGPLSNFAQTAAVTWGNYVYLFGTPAGRTGAVKLARALASQAAYSYAYQYWDGLNWQAREANGIYIVPAQVAELSVQFDPALGRFVMTYLDQVRQEIVMRDAPSIEGPYGGEKPILNAYAGTLYGGYANPITGTGRSVTLNVSSWQDYNVFQYTTPLTVRTQADNLLGDNGFEEGFASVGRGWSAAGLPAGTSAWPSVPSAPQQTTHGGSHAAFIGAADGLMSWHDVHQTLTVKPGANYQIVAWVQGSNVSAAFVGVRTAGAPVPVNRTDTCNGFVEDPANAHTTVAVKGAFKPTASYSQVYLQFNAGSNNTVEFYAGCYGNGSGTWMGVDDVTVTPNEVAPDFGFEQQATSGVGWPYLVEGPSTKGIDHGLGFSRSGQADAWMRTNDANEWNAITEVVPVTPNTYYYLTGYTETSPTFGTGYFGVRDASTNAVITQTTYGASPCSNASPSCYAQSQVPFFSGARTSVRVFAGYWSPTRVGDTWVRLDDVGVEPLSF